MRSVSGTRLVAASPEQAFARLAAFDSTASWDPGVHSARQLDPGPPTVGTRFAVVARFAGRNVPMDYVITVYEPPKRLELKATAHASTARDVIHIEPAGTGSKITWTLELELLGMGRLFEPFLGPMLRRLAKRALDGLAQDLGQA